MGGASNFVRLSGVHINGTAVYLERGRDVIYKSSIEFQLVTLILKENPAIQVRCEQGNHEKDRAIQIPDF